jgi:hypothetical protein
VSTWTGFVLQLQHLVGGSIFGADRKGKREDIMIKLVEWSSEIQVQKRRRMDARAEREAVKARREAKIRVNMQRQEGKKQRFV